MVVCFMKACCCAVLMSLTIVLLAPSIAPGSFVINTANTTATKAGTAGAHNDFDEYPRPGDSGTSVGSTTAGTSDGATAQDSFSFTTGVSGSAMANAGGSSTATTPVAAGASIGSLQAIASAGASGGGSVIGSSPGLVVSPSYASSSVGDPLPVEIGAAFGYNANHTANTNVNATGVNNGPFNLVLVGKLYAAVSGGCSSSSTANDFADCGEGAMANANVEGHNAAAGLGQGQNTSDFQTFRVTIGDAIGGITAAANSAANVNGDGFIDSLDGGSAMANGVATSVAAAYAWFIPDPLNPVAQGEDGPSMSMSGIVEGDVTFDNLLDADDIDAIAAESRQLQGGSSPDPFSVFSGAEPLYDVNYDLRVDYGITYSGAIVSDSDYMVRTLLGTEYGDVNLDGVVDDADKLILFSNWSGPGGWAEGDLNGDNVVNAADYTVWRDFKGFGVAIAVPEASSLSLAALLAAACSLKLRLGQS